MLQAQWQLDAARQERTSAEHLAQQAEAACHDLRVALVTCQCTVSQLEQEKAQLEQEKKELREVNELLCCESKADL